ncbi:MAG: tetratricopeptide repeat protein [Saprospiraceae bacterium]
MKKTTTIILLQFIISIVGLAQNRDSLLQITKDATSSDTARMQSYIGLVKMTLGRDMEMAQKYAHQLTELSGQKGNKKYEVMSYNALGIIHSKMDDNFDSVFYYLNLAIETAKPLKDKQLNINLYNSLGYAYLHNYQYDKAMEVFLMAVEDAKEVDEAALTLLYNNIAIIFKEKKEYKKAISWLKRCLAISKKLNNQETVSAAYNNIGNNYKQLGQLDSALFYCEKALELKKIEKDVYGEIASYINISRIHLRQDFRELAFDYASKAYQKSTEINHPFGVGKSLLLLSDIAFKNQNYSKAAAYAEQCLSINLAEVRSPALSILHESHAKMGNYKQSYQYLLEVKTLSDSLFSTENEENLRELEIKYNVKQKDTENQLLKVEATANGKTIQSRNLIALALLLGLLLVTSWGVWVYRSRRQTKKNNEILEQKVAERTKELEQANYELRTFNYIASHDIKEPIRVIGGYVGLIRRKLPTDLKESLSEYFETIKRSTNQLYTLIEDFAHYTTMSKNDTIEKEAVDLNQLTYGVINNLQESIGKYNGQVLVADLPTIKTGHSLLFTTLKNLIENGLKYNNSEKPTVNIDYNKTETYHEIIVSDNGIGIEKQYHERIFEMFKRLHNRGAYEGSGIGLAIVKLSVEKLGGTVEIESEEGKGSRFVIELPLT